MNASSLENLRTVNPGTVGHPASLSRLKALPLPVKPNPALVLMGVAQDVTTARMKKAYGNGFEIVRVGDASLYLEHQGEPGWAPMFRLKPGQAYEVVVAKVTGPVDPEQVPYDRRSETAAVFYAQARKQGVSVDELDRRRKVGPGVALWTDGLALCSVGTASLVANAWYQVTLSEVQAN